MRRKSFVRGEAEGATYVEFFQQLDRRIAMPIGVTAMFMAMCLVFAAMLSRVRGT